MANQEHLNMLKQGVKAWNQWRQEQQDVIPDLSGANLSGASLSKADLSHVDLRRAGLSRANLIGADLSRAKLSNAHLNGAYLSGTSVTPEQLGEARSLKDTIRPDGSKHS